jgi:dihydrolipoamide dehydrogenase
MADTYDVIIIGAGPGGYVAAIRAAQLGLKTAIVEREHLGGICLNWGCIPTKALLRSAEIYHYMTHAKDYGLTASNVGFDPAAVVARSRAVAKQLSNGVAFLMKKNKITVIEGAAKISKPGEVAVEGKGAGKYQAKHIIVATGARPRVLPGIEPDKKLIWTYFEAMVPEKMPKSLLVIGSGAIGIEIASFYRTLGTEVTVVEVLPQILPVEDEEIVAFARKRFEKQGIKILTSAKVGGVEKKKDSVVATIEDSKGAKQTIEAERVISAVGVVGNIENLGLEALGVKTERGTVAIDGFGRTNVAGIYAIGDVAGPPMLAHKAEHEGVICIEAIKGLKPHPLDKLKIPGCTIAIRRSRRALRKSREGEGSYSRRQVPVPRQRQGDRARRAGRVGQDDLRQEDRRAIGRTSRGRGSHRADSGFHDRDESGDHRGRADPRRVPASDALGNDARERALRL